MALTVSMLVQLSCAPSRDHFDTDLPPPTGRETYAEVLPVQIDGIDAEIQLLERAGGRLRGVRASYGDRASIEIVQSPVLSDLQAHAGRHLARWSPGDDTSIAQGLAAGWKVDIERAAGRLLAWRNQDWLFVITAASAPVFDEAVDRFAFVRRH